MSEATIQTAVQETLQAMDAFGTGDVVINDWGILDGSMNNAPYVIIETADAVTSRQDTVTPVTNWQIPVTLFERFTDWAETYNNLRDRRQAIIDTFNEIGANRSPGLGAVTADVIRTDGPVGQWYDPNMDTGDNPLPVFITQRMILEIEEY